jgi:Ser/Thr protein kinase RdoA (MazF antagonist)
MRVMMKLSEIRRLVDSLDADRRSPVADAVAAHWGYPPGAARFRRSSANHVFALTGQTGEVDAFLRFASSAHRPRSRVAKVVAFMDALAVHGVSVVRPIASGVGRRVETVETEIGTVHAMVVTAAAGVEIEVDALTTAGAHAWGRALAELHDAGGDAGAAVGLTSALAVLAEGLNRLDGDRALAAALAELIGRLDNLPIEHVGFGVTHGDFELDNLIWAGDQPTALDFDEAARSWFVADIGYAVRDLGPVPAQTPVGTEAPMFGAFLAGYRQCRALPERDLGNLPLFAAMRAAVDFIRLRAVLDAGTEPRSTDLIHGGHWLSDAMPLLILIVVGG